MRDPHVEMLFFTCEPSGTVSFKNPPPLSRENDICSLKLDNGILEVKPKEHYVKADEARRVIDPFLRAWEFDSDLREGLGYIRFKYRNAKIVDRNPPPPGSAQTIEVEGVAEITFVSDSATIHLEKSNYPEPPLFHGLPPDADSMWYRYVRYVNGQEPLQAMAYFCLTVVQSIAPDNSKDRRKDSGKHYNIGEKVLEMLGNLTAKGDPKTARKVEKGHPYRPLSDLERSWIDSAIKAIIRRVVEQSAGIPGPQLSMKDLPSL